ncbi:MAG: N(4)-(beta-N-acetylglucosaminyl)-L-asparaginase [Bacteroidetes bacterium]|nr:N(4)-(beta-N-acetylglucosaminyl)-L-asparaginase [Bacteroidota bacterium]
MHRRKLLKLGSFGLGALATHKLFATGFSGHAERKPIVLSTWDAGIEANKAAWKILRENGHALDAVEQGVMVTESSQNCCVGLGANPDRDGYVTLDASIMNGNGDCGAVAFLERIKHPISVARRVMEKTPHVFLVGSGAQQFAVEEGFPLEKQVLSSDAQKTYDEWLKEHHYKPQVNIENSKGQQAFAPSKLSNNQWNHDTIGMIALDGHGNLGGSCTTSGMAFKMRGRVGDSPIIGAGLFVDNEAGAAVSTGLGEEVIRTCGTHLVVEFMRQGLSPRDACKNAVSRIIDRYKNTDKIKDIQVGFIALSPKGEYGGFCIHSGFNYAVCYADTYNQLINSEFIYK